MLLVRNIKLRPGYSKTDLEQKLRKKIYGYEYIYNYIGNKNISDNPNIIKKVKVANSSYVNNKSMLKGKYITLREFKIEKIIFQMRYNTQMGEDLGVIGSINDLGCWDQGRALRMTWNKGNIWRGAIVFNNNQIIDFEYKFIFISKGYVQQWEEGNNRKFILSQIKKHPLIRML